MFRVTPLFERKKLDTIFRHKIFKTLMAKRKITREVIVILSSWRHSPRKACSTWIRR
jgi:hypothetical protein